MDVKDEDEPSKMMYLSSAPQQILPRMFPPPAEQPSDEAADRRGPAPVTAALEGNIDEDAALMLRVRDARDLAAFEELVTRYKDGVYGLVLKMLDNSADAEDVAQQVFVRVWKSARRYKPKARFSTWLFTIARNLALNEVRRRKRHPLNSLDAPADRESGNSHGDDAGAHDHLADPGQASPGEQALHQEMQDAIETAIQDLPENQRTALTLWRFEDMAYEDIAQVLGTSVSSVKSLLFRARTTLRTALQEYLAE